MPVAVHYWYTTSSMENPKLHIDFTGWQIGGDLEKMFQKAMLDTIAAFVADLLTDPETTATKQPDGVLIENPRMSDGALIRWAHFDTSE